MSDLIKVAGAGKPRYEDDLRSFLDCMPDTVTIETSTGTNIFGEPTFARSRSYRARWVGVQRMVRDFTGEETMSAGTLWIASTSVFGPGDRITLPDGTKPPMLAVEAFRDGKGIHHIRVALGF